MKEEETNFAMLFVPLGVFLVMKMFKMNGKLLEGFGSFCIIIH